MATTIRGTVPAETKATTIPGTVPAEITATAIPETVRAETMAATIPGTAPAETIRAYAPEIRDIVPDKIPDIAPIPATVQIRDTDRDITPVLARATDSAPAPAAPPGDIFTTGVHTAR